MVRMLFATLVVALGLCATASPAPSPLPAPQEKKAKKQDAPKPGKTKYAVVKVGDAYQIVAAGEVNTLKKNGLALGGSLDNAVVIDNFSVLNPGGLRYADEFVRHKVVDLIGDLALLGGVLAAKVVAYKPGHRLHRALIQKIAARDSGCWVTAAPAWDEAGNRGFEPALRLPNLQRA